MVNIAVAGGTSATLGRSIVEAIFAQDGRHDVIILTRAQESQLDKEAPTTKYGARVVAVDYSSKLSLIAVFKKHDIHKIVSVLKPINPEQSVTYHANLLAAAQEAKITNLIMSDWSMGPLSHAQVGVLAHKDELHRLGQSHMQEADEKGDWKVDCATIQNGMFMEYLVQGCPNSSSEDEHGMRLDAGLVDKLMLSYIDIAKNKLVVPCGEDGTFASISTTSIKDIGRYIAASLALPRGKLVGQISLESCQLPSLAWVADFLKQKCNHRVQVDAITPSQCDEIVREQNAIFQKDMQENGNFNIESFMQGMAAQMMKVSCLAEVGGGVLDMESKPSLNSLCPDIHPVRVEDLLVRAWHGCTYMYELAIGFREKVC